MEQKENEVAGTATGFWLIPADERAQKALPSEAGN